MRTEYFITMDVHCRTADVCIKTAHGKLVLREHVRTGIPQLLEVIESVPRPRRLALEEKTRVASTMRACGSCATS